MKKIITFVMVVLLIFSLSGCFRAVRTANRMIDDAFETVEDEFSPSELLRKYEWFKDALASLDSKAANIKSSEIRMKTMEESYEDTPRKDWDRTDKETYNLWVSETAGMKISYNNLAAEYNSQMAKFNWRFTNAGTLPKGATEILPREVREYLVD